MDYQTIYLRAADRATVIQALTEAGMWQDDAFVRRSPGDCFAEVGAIRKPTGNKIVVDGVEEDETAPVAGWHANLILAGEVPAALAAIAIPKPAHPVHEFARA